MKTALTFTFCILFPIVVMSKDESSLEHLPAKGFAHADELLAFFEKQQGRQKGNSVITSEIDGVMHYFCSRHAALGGVFEEFTVFQQEKNGRIGILCHFPFSFRSYKVNRAIQEVKITVFDGEERTIRCILIFGSGQ